MISYIILLHLHIYLHTDYCIPSIFLPLRYSKLIIFLRLINFNNMMQSRLPTASLYLDSHLPSPKNRQESTLVASRQKNRAASNDSFSILPLKEPIPTTDRNLSSLILIPSPVKTAPQNQKAQNSSKLDQNGSNQVQMHAMNLSANIFMNSTTKFLKGFAGNPDSASAQKQKKDSPDRGNRLMTVGKGQSLQKNAIDVQKSNIIGSVPKQQKQTNTDTVVYPSREKIDNILRGQSNKKGLVQSNSAQNLQQTLSGNRVSKDRSNSNESTSHRSRSGSTQRLSRKRQRSRQLKFLEKKEKQENSSTLKQAEKVQVPQQNSNKIGLKTQKGNNRTNINQIKSADTKKPEESSRSQVKPTLKANQKANFQTNPSILSNTSNPQPKAANKREGFKPIHNISSGQLPLQTPVKPSQKKTQPKKSAHSTAIQKQTYRLKTQPSQISQICQIKQQKTSEMQSVKPIAKNKQIVFQKSSKEQPSTYIHQNATEVVVWGANETNISKFGKNMSTKALGLLFVSKLNNPKDINPEHRKEEMRKVESAKTINRKLQSSNIIPVEPITSSLSILQEKKTFQPSTFNKKNSKAQPKLGLSSKISIEQQLIAKKQEKSQNMDKISFKINNLKKSLALIKTIGRIYALRLSDGLLKIKNCCNFRKIHVREANIILNQSSNFYNNAYRNILKVSFEQLKKLTLGNSINKKPSLNLDNSKLTAVNIIFRTALSKHRQNWHFLKYFSSKIMRFPSVTQRQTKIYESYNVKPFILQQLGRIFQRSNKNKLHTSIAKIWLYSSTQNKPSQRPILPHVRSPSKPIKSPRNYQEQKSALINQKQSLQYDISRIQWILLDKKRHMERQKVRLAKSQAQLTNRNRSIQDEVIQKRTQSTFLKGRVKSSQNFQQIDFLLPQCEPFMDILTDIYSIVFRSGDEKIDPNHFIQKHSLNKEQPNDLRSRWSAMSLNITLKSRITEWQGPMKAHHAKKYLMAEQQLILNVLRGYMRQRYLWQWLRVASESL